MASQILTSVMEESYNTLRNFIKLSQCSRRKQVPTPPQTTFKKVVLSEEHYDADDTSSTEPGDCSNNEFSDHHYQTDESSTSVRPAAVRPPPGLSAPPGLEAFGTAMPCRVESSLNANAACFQPSFAQAPPSANSQQLRQSIGMLKGALQEWEANLPEPAAAPAQQLQAPHGESTSLFALQQALTNLSPQDTSALRSFLDFKEASQQIAMITPAVYQQCRTPVCRTPLAQVQRPFTPFQGNRTAPWEQARLTRDAPKALPKVAAESSAAEESLSSYLRDLALMDNSRVLMLRRINRLGLNSQAPLEEYFSQFGKVSRVMVAPTRSKAQFGQAKARVRPAPLGFLVMDTAEEAQAAISAGAEHIIQGECISVLPFESHGVEQDAK